MILSELPPISKAREAVIPCPYVDRVLLAERLMGTKVDIVGTETDENGRTCHAHDVCGSQLVPGSKVHVRKETVISPTMGNKEDCLVAYIVCDGVMT
jgi:hypothetical protein